MQRERRRARTAALALLGAGAVTGAVLLVTAGPGRHHSASPPADSGLCTTAAYPDAPETGVPTPVAASLIPTVATPAGAGPGISAWTGAWSTAQQDLSGREPRDRADLTGRTLRQVVHPSIGGSRFRIRLANPFGPGPLRFSGVSAAVAVATGQPGLRTGTAHRVTFGGAGEIEIPPGGRVISDPIVQSYRFGQSLAVDLVPQGPAPAVSGHSRSASTSFLGRGDRAGQIGGSGFRAAGRSWYWLEGVDVPDPGRAGSISAFGDSITEGMWSTPDTDRRWPDLLAARMRTDAGPAGTGVLNEGIGGNRVLADNLSCLSPSASGLRRFDHDVLSRPDVRVVVIALGINDIGHGSPAADVIDGLATLSARAHARGLRVVGATLTPYSCPAGCLSAEKEQQRQLVNDWIRTTPDLDAVVDFDAALRDPADPQRMRAVDDSGDHLHPGDAGMQAMADAFDLPTLSALSGR